MSAYRPAPGAAVVEEDDVLYAAVLPDGPIVVLDGVAGLIWAEACDGDPSRIADRVAAVTDTRADDIRAEVEAFIDELVRRGLLTVR